MADGWEGDGPHPHAVCPKCDWAEPIESPTAGWKKYCPDCDGFVRTEIDRQ